jgi:hypothetical protein
MIGCSSPGGGLGIFLSNTASKTALGPTQPPIQWVPAALSLGLKRPGREADHSPPSSSEVKNTGSYTPLPQYVFMACCSVKAQGRLYFYLYISMNLTLHVPNLTSISRCLDLSKESYTKLHKIIAFRTRVCQHPQSDSPIWRNTLCWLSTTASILINFS